MPSHSTVNVPGFGEVPIVALGTFDDGFGPAGFGSEDEEPIFLSPLQRRLRERGGLFGPLGMLSGMLASGGLSIGSGLRTVRTGGSSAGIATGSGSAAASSDSRGTNNNNNNTDGTSGAAGGAAAAGTGTGGRIGGGSVASQQSRQLGLLDLHDRVSSLTRNRIQLLAHSPFSSHRGSPLSTTATGSGLAPDAVWSVNPVFLEDVAAGRDTTADRDGEDDGEEADYGEEEDGDDDGGVGEGAADGDDGDDGEEEDARDHVEEDDEQEEGGDGEEEYAANFDEEEEEDFDANSYPVDLFNSDSDNGSEVAIATMGLDDGAGFQQDTNAASGDGGAGEAVPAATAAAAPVASGVANFRAPATWLGPRAASGSSSRMSNADGGRDDGGGDGLGISEEEEPLLAAHRAVEAAALPLRPRSTPSGAGAASAPPAAAAMDYDAGSESTAGAAAGRVCSDSAVDDALVESFQRESHLAYDTVTEPAGAVILAGQGQGTGPGEPGGSGAGRCRRGRSLYLASWAAAARFTLSVVLVPLRLAMFVVNLSSGALAAAMMARPRRRLQAAQQALAASVAIARGRDPGRRVPAAADTDGAAGTAAVGPAVPSGPAAASGQARRQQQQQPLQQQQRNRQQQGDGALGSSPRVLLGTTTSASRSSLHSRGRGQIRPVVVRPRPHQCVSARVAGSGGAVSRTAAGAAPAAVSAQLALTRRTGAAAGSAAAATDATAATTAVAMAPVGQWSSPSSQCSLAVQPLQPPGRAFLSLPAYQPQQQPQQRTLPDARRVEGSLFGIAEGTLDAAAAALQGFRRLAEMEGWNRASTPTSESGVALWDEMTSDQRHTTAAAAATIPDMRVPAIAAVTGAGAAATAAPNGPRGHGAPGPSLRLELHHHTVDGFGTASAAAAATISCSSAAARSFGGPPGASRHLRDDVGGVVAEESASTGAGSDLDLDLESELERLGTELEQLLSLAAFRCAGPEDWQAGAPRVPALAARRSAGSRCRHQAPSRGGGGGAAAATAVASTPSSPLAAAETNTQGPSTGLACSGADRELGVRTRQMDGWSSITGRPRPFGTARALMPRWVHNGWDPNPWPGHHNTLQLQNQLQLWDQHHGSSSSCETSLPSAGVAGSGAALQPVISSSADVAAAQAPLLLRRNRYCYPEPIERLQRLLLRRAASLGNLRGNPMQAMESPLLPSLPSAAAALSPATLVRAPAAAAAAACSEPQLLPLPNTGLDIRALNLPPELLPGTWPNTERSAAGRMGTSSCGGVVLGEGARGRSRRHGHLDADGNEDDDAEGDDDGCWAWSRQRLRQQSGGCGVADASDCSRPQRRPRRWQQRVAGLQSCEGRTHGEDGGEGGGDGDGDGDGGDSDGASLDGSGGLWRYYYSDGNTDHRALADQAAHFCLGTSLLAIHPSRQRTLSSDGDRGRGGSGRSRGGLGGMYCRAAAAWPGLGSVSRNPWDTWGMSRVDLGSASPHLRLRVAWGDQRFDHATSVAASPPRRRRQQVRSVGAACEGLTLPEAGAKVQPRGENGSPAAAEGVARTGGLASGQSLRGAGSLRCLRVSSGDPGAGSLVARTTLNTSTRPSSPGHARQCYPRTLLSPPPPPPRRQALSTVSNVEDSDDRSGDSELEDIAARMLPPSALPRDHRAAPLALLGTGQAMAVTCGPGPQLALAEVVEAAGGDGGADGVLSSSPLDPQPPEDSSVFGDAADMECSWTHNPQESASDGSGGGGGGPDATRPARDRLAAFPGFGTRLRLPADGSDADGSESGDGSSVRNGCTPPRGSPCSMQPVRAGVATHAAADNRGCGAEDGDDGVDLPPLPSYGGSDAEREGAADPAGGSGGDGSDSDSDLSPPPLVYSEGVAGEEEEASAGGADGSDSVLELLPLFDNAVTSITRSYRDDADGGNGPIGSGFLGSNFNDHLQGLSDLFDEDGMYDDESGEWANAARPHSAGAGQGGMMGGVGAAGRAGVDVDAVVEATDSEDDDDGLPEMLSASGELGPSGAAGWRRLGPAAAAAVATALPAGGGAGVFAGAATTAAWCQDAGTIPAHAVARATTTDAAAAAAAAAPPPPPPPPPPLLGSWGQGSGAQPRSATTFPSSRAHALPQPPPRSRSSTPVSSSSALSPLPRLHTSLHGSAERLASVAAAATHGSGPHGSGRDGGGGQGFRSGLSANGRLVRLRNLSGRAGAREQEVFRRSGALESSSDGSSDSMPPLVSPESQPAHRSRRRQDSPPPLTVLDNSDGEFGAGGSGGGGGRPSAVWPGSRRAASPQYRQDSPTATAAGTVAAAATAAVPQPAPQHVHRDPGLLASWRPDNANTSTTAAAAIMDSAWNAAVEAVLRTLFDVRTVVGAAAVSSTGTGSAALPYTEWSARLREQQPLAAASPSSLLRPRATATASGGSSSGDGVTSQIVASLVRIPADMLSNVPAGSVLSITIPAGSLSGAGGGSGITSGGGGGGNVAGDGDGPGGGSRSSSSSTATVAATATAASILPLQLGALSSFPLSWRSYLTPEDYSGRHPNDRPDLPGTYDEQDIPAWAARFAPPRREATLEPDTALSHASSGDASGGGGGAAATTEAVTMSTTVELTAPGEAGALRGEAGGVTGAAGGGAGTNINPSGTSASLQALWEEFSFSFSVEADRENDEGEGDEDDNNDDGENDDLESRNRMARAEEEDEEISYQASADDGGGGGGDDDDGRQSDTESFPDSLPDLVPLEDFFVPTVQPIAAAAAADAAASSPPRPRPRSEARTGEALAAAAIAEGEVAVSPPLLQAVHSTVRGLVAADGSVEDGEQRIRLSAGMGSSIRRAVGTDGGGGPDVVLGGVSADGADTLATAVGADSGDAIAAEQFHSAAAHVPHELEHTLDGARDRRPVATADGARAGPGPGPGPSTASSGTDERGLGGRELNDDSDDADEDGDEGSDAGIPRVSHGMLHLPLPRPVEQQQQRQYLHLHHQEQQQQESAADSPSQGLQDHRSTGPILECAPEAAMPGAESAATLSSAPGGHRSGGLIQGDEARSERGGSAPARVPLPPMPAGAGAAPPQLYRAPAGQHGGHGTFSRYAGPLMEEWQAAAAAAEEEEEEEETQRVAAGGMAGAAGGRAVWGVGLGGRGGVGAAGAAAAGAEAVAARNTRSPAGTTTIATTAAARRNAVTYPRSVLLSMLEALRSAETAMSSALQGGGTRGGTGDATVAAATAASASGLPYGPAGGATPPPPPPRPDSCAVTTAAALLRDGSFVAQLLDGLPGVTANPPASCVLETVRMLSDAGPAAVAAVAVAAVGGVYV